MEENKQLFVFKRQKFGPSTYATTEHSYICSEHSKWDPILLQFAEFLDEIGYVGVYDRIEKMLEREGFL